MPTPICIVTHDEEIRTTLHSVAASLSVTPRPEDAEIVVQDAPDGGVAFAILVSDSVHASGRGGVVIGREAFLSDPKAVVEMVCHIVKQRKALARASSEVEFARHLRHLMGLGDLSLVFRTVCETAIELSGAEVTTLLLHDPVIERYAVGYSNDADLRDNGDYLPGISPDVLQQAITAECRYALRPPTGARGGQLVVPLRLGEDLLGVVMLAKPRGSSFDESAAERAATYILTVGPFLVTVHQLSRSRDLALRDDLTKAYNRRFFDSHLDEEIERARRYNSLVSVIFLDLDDLKLINNLYGHLSGSRMLQEVAKRILGAVRAIDKVVRFGGDEFCIVLPQTDAEQARAVANRVRRAMGERKFVLDGGIEIAMTASFGIASYPVHAHTKEELIRAADAAMYRVKSTSKNSIEVAPLPSAATMHDPEPAL